MNSILCEVLVFFSNYALTKKFFTPTLNILALRPLYIGAQPTLSVF